MKTLRCLLTLSIVIAVTASMVSANLVPVVCGCAPPLESAAPHTPETPLSCCSSQAGDTPTDHAPGMESHHSGSSCCGSGQGCACEISGCAPRSGDSLTAQPSPRPNRDQDVITLLPAVTTPPAIPKDPATSKGMVFRPPAPSRPIFLHNSVFRI